MKYNEANKLNYTKKNIIEDKNSWQAKVWEFTCKARNGKLPERPKLVKKEEIEHLCNMVNDELVELKKAKAGAEQVDAIVDAIYYLLDAACRYGIDLNPFFEIIHKNNMTKLNNKIIISKNGKVEKPKDFVDPRMPILEEYKRQKSTRI